MTNSRLSAAPKAHAGAAAGVVNTARMIGATLGVAVLGGIFAAHAGENPVDPERIVAGLHWAFVGGAISEILGALTAWRWIPSDALAVVASAPFRSLAAFGSYSAGTC
jgi:MFS family permease